jgi:DnaJ-class molecular chaperone
MIEQDEGLDLYAVLNGKQTDSEQQLRKNYFALARVLHPDKQLGLDSEASSEEFIRLEMASKILTNPLTRLIYDRFGLRGISVYEQFKEEFEEYSNTLKQPCPQEKREAVQKVFGPTKWLVGGADADGGPDAQWVCGRRSRRSEPQSEDEAKFA